MAYEAQEHCENDSEDDSLVALALEEAGDSENCKGEYVVGEDADHQHERRKSPREYLSEISWSSEKMNAEPKLHLGPCINPIRQTGSILSGVTEPPNGISKSLKRLRTKDSAMSIAHSTMMCSFWFFINTSEKIEK